MKKLILDSDREMKEDVTEGTLLQVLHFACAEFFPEIKRAGSRRCALSIGRLLLAIFSKKRLPV